MSLVLMSLVPEPSSTYRGRCGSVTCDLHEALAILELVNRPDVDHLPVLNAVQQT